MLLLLCYPRVLGFRVQPALGLFRLCVDGRLIGVHYEVRNHFRRAPFLCGAGGAGATQRSGLRQEADKLFYVRPSCPWSSLPFPRSRPPGAEDIAVRIHETDAEGPILAATFHGKAERISASPA